MIAEHLIAGGLDRLFSQTPGARDALARHAGRILALDGILFSVRLQVTEDGGLRAAGAAPADATILLAPDVLLSLPVRGKAALQSLRTEGNAELLSAFNDAFQQIDLDAEAELSRLFGPIIGFRMAEAGRAFSGWMKQATQDTARALAEYAVEESPMLASRREIERFNREVDELRDEAARLEARLDRLNPVK
ncbi:MAG: hypothetical protein AB1591_00610 [Pseudomonadota bacterium]